MPELKLSSKLSRRIQAIKLAPISNGETVASQLLASLKSLIALCIWPFSVTGKTARDKSNPLKPEVNLKSKTIIEEFERSWDFARQLTLDFVDAIPADRWDFTFNAKYSPLNKQLRHMVWVTGLYTKALETGTLDLKTKKQNYSGGLERTELTEALKASDKPLKARLTKLKTESVENISVDAFGMKMGFTEFSHLLLHHESNHHGLWSVYATEAGFSTPKSWKESWGL